MQFSFRNIGFGAITTICVLFLGQQANALSTPSIELGSNPVVSSNCTSDYTVPTGQVLIITDLVAYGTSSGYYGSAIIKKDGSDLIKTGGLLVSKPATVANFRTGFKAEENTIVACDMSYASLSWSGYLARP